MAKKKKKFEWFNACDHIAAYSLPLIKKLRKHGNGHPEGITTEEWHKILDEIIYVWEHRWKKWEPEREQKAMENFGKYFCALWD